MAYKDVLLGLVPYPEPTRGSVVDQAVDIAVAIGGKISALACGIKILASGSILARALFHAAAKAAAETGNANENAETIGRHFRKLRNSVEHSRSGSSSIVYRLKYPKS